MLQPNPDYMKELTDLVTNSPYPSHMAMQMTGIDLDRAEIRLKTAQCHLQPYGLVHGGVLATLIDTATFWAVFMRVPEDAGLVNVDLKMNYLKPVEAGRTLIAAGRAIRTGKSLSYAEAGVYDPDNDLVAHGTSTLMTLPGRGLKLKAKKFL